MFHIMLLFGRTIHIRIIEIDDYEHHVIPEMEVHNCVIHKSNPCPPYAERVYFLLSAFVCFSQINEHRE